MAENKQEIHLIAPRSYVSQEMREQKYGHRGMVFWMTGLSGSGKSTLAHLAERSLFLQDRNVVVFDGDAIRTGLCRDLGFSSEDRRENNRRVAEAARLFVRTGSICLCAFISPAAEFCSMAKEIVSAAYFREIFIDCSAEECERRDCKGFYSKARRGEIQGYTGVSSSYEPPEQSDCVIRTEGASIDDSLADLLEYINGQSLTHHQDKLS